MSQDSDPTACAAPRYPLLEGIQGPADVHALERDQLPQLCDEMRSFLLESVQRTGGHLGSNLGIVELTTALHRVYDFGRDRVVFDVSHQCYPHKLLTGRAKLLPKLRQDGGMAGFPEPRESDFDLFSVGHAGTAISTAVGMAPGDALQGRGNRRCVALIGDASIVMCEGDVRTLTP